MVAGGVSDVRAQLIFLLVAQRGEQSDRSGELVVAEGFEAGDGERRRAEWESQSKAKRRGARLREMQFAGIEDKRSQPGWAEDESVADDAVPIVVVGGEPGGGQSSLLHQRVVRQVAVL